MRELLLVDADPECAREVERRLCVRVLSLDGSHFPLDDHPQDWEWLNQTQAVAFLGRSVRMEWLSRCIRAGKPVLVKSVCCDTFEQLDQLMSLQKECPPGRTCFIELGNPLFSLPSRRLIFDRLASGDLGQTGMLRIHRWTALSSKASGDAVNLRPESASLSDELECVLNCFADLPIRVFAIALPQQQGLLIHLTFRQGGMATIDLASIAGPQGYTSFSVIASKGAAYADDHAVAQMHFHASGASAAVSPETTSLDGLMVVRFANALCEKSPRIKETGFSATPAQVRRRLALLSAIDQSLKHRIATDISLSQETNDGAMDHV